MVTTVRVPQMAQRPGTLRTLLRTGWRLPTTEMRRNSMTKRKTTTGRKAKRRRTTRKAGKRMLQMPIMQDRVCVPHTFA